jgi:uncharacterized protein
MKELLEYIVKNLVSNPESVVVEEETSEGNINLYLTVHPDDMGIVIGKGGQTIHSLRKILTVRAIAENVRVNLQLNEPAGGDQRQESKPQEEAEDSAEETKTTEEISESPEEEKSQEETPEESESKD